MSSVVWHDLECGAYREDLALWRELARSHGSPILDIGAGTGRVALTLAADGHDLTALDNDGELLDVLRRRAAGLTVTTVLADAREFSLPRRFALCVVAMQTVQLLGGVGGRARFLATVRAHLRPGGRVALSISEQLEPFSPDAGALLPLPDICEREGTVYSSQATAVRDRGASFVLERRREIVDPGGAHQVTHDLIALDALSADALQAEAERAGLRPAGTVVIPSTADYVASTVVMLDG